MDLFIGTSGWAYPEWQPAFYPAGMPRHSFLEYHATRFTACEVNGTFYRLPSPETVHRWAEQTPPTFRFTVKAPRAMVRGSVEWTDDVLRIRDRLMSALEPLGERLAAVLLRYPDGVVRDDANLGAILRSWESGAPPLVFDFRDPTWSDAEVTTAIARHGHAVAVNDTAGEPPPTLPPGGIAYIRLRAEHYSDAGRRAWLEAARSEAEHRPVHLVGRHDGIPAGDPHAGVGLAAWLIDHARDGAA